MNGSSNKNHHFHMVIAYFSWGVSAPLGKFRTFPTYYFFTFINCTKDFHCDISVQAYVILWSYSSPHYCFLLPLSIIILKGFMILFSFFLLLLLAYINSKEGFHDSIFIQVYKVLPSIFTRHQPLLSSFPLSLAFPHTVPLLYSCHFLSFIFCIWEKSCDICLSVILLLT
jgi:hypothetical protein